MPQKRKASALASAKIAEDAAGGRRRKSDPKNPINNNNGNGNEEKDDSTESPPDKRRRKSEENDNAENNQQNGNNGLKQLDIDNSSMMSMSSIKDTQGSDLANMDYELSAQKEEKSKTDENPEEKVSQQPTTNNDNKIDEKSYEKVIKENEQELEKKMYPKTLEKGHICFLYRPKVNVEEPKSIEEVQRMHIVLLPHLVRHSLEEEPVKSYSHLSIQGKLDEHSNAEKPHIGKSRVITIGKKKLPEIEKHSKFWGYIDKAFNDSNELKEFVSGRTYQTATKGQQALQDCRIFGRGVYNIVEHHGHTHLAYVLEIPEEPTEIQKEFNVNKEGTYNPDISNPSYTGLSGHEKVIYPDRLVQKFQGRRFISLETTEFLDYNGTELLFIGAKEDIAQDLGEAGKELEELAEYETKTIVPFAERVVFDDLHFEKGVLPIEPLHGLWK
ncbi:10080_t:CDS:2 [Entrophospora sp. SA101]|nr:10080_t:CDS:2 [Entrophospora sp. SA101]CAJ0846250.1 1839_t:CDS:2 [Entrophospora sp. SA101]CAJ0896800.1 6815_t:CDS:2 [Entrophospora sp. SA101]